MIIESYFHFNSEQDISKNNSCCVSSQSTIGTDKTPNFNTFNEKKFVSIELSDDSQETNVEQENDPLNVLDCIYNVLDSGIYPRRETNTVAVNMVFDQSDSSLIDMLYENHESFNDSITQTGSTHPSSSNHGQILPAIQVDQSDTSPIASSSYQSCCDQLHELMFIVQNVFDNGSTLQKEY